MRRLAVMALLLTGCGPGLKFDKSPTMTADQMLGRATLVFVGTIEKHIFANWPFLSIPGENSTYWRVLDRRVRIEAIARGEESRRVIDVYEIFWVGGTTGDWNSTQDNRRYLFLVRSENGRYHVVRDWWRSIFPIGSGKHDRFPLDALRPVWERVALLQFWASPGWNPGFFSQPHLDPGGALSRWRRVKLLRGLVRYPDSGIRVGACAQLMQSREDQNAQDECFEQLDADGQRTLGRYHQGQWPLNRRWEKESSHSEWEYFRSHKNDPAMRDRMRLFTTVNNRPLREQFCRLFQQEFPNDHDNGCPANQPPPATIVTENGDVPLLGEWPSNTNK